jgi:type V secretory pathway adhesin AidA
VEGWSAGAFSTLYRNDENKLDVYDDTWLQYGWFNKSHRGDLPHRQLVALHRQQQLQRQRVAAGQRYPEIRHELRLGMNADFRKHWTGWTNVSVSWGAQRFYKYAVRVG